MHALAVVSVLICGLAWPLKLVGCALVLAHSLLRRPPAPVALIRRGDGSWDVPVLGLARLTLRPGSAVGPFWIFLRLGRGGARPVAVLLLADQVDRETWRTLHAELRGRGRSGTVRARHRGRFNLE